MKADVLFLRGDAVGGIAACHEALARNPRSIEALIAIAGAQGILGNLDSLRAVIGTMSSIPGPAASITSRAGEIFLRLVQGRFHEGEALAARTEKELGGRYRSSLEYFVARFRAGVLLELGRGDEAVSENRFLVESAGRFNPYRGAGYAPLVECLVRAGRVKEAEGLLLDYDRMLKKDPLKDEVENRNFLAGLVALGKGRPRDAAALFRDNNPFGPALVRDWHRRWLLARALLAAGEKDGAAVELEEVVKLAPGGGDPIDTFHAIVMLGRLYEERGRREDALALYRRVAKQYKNAEPGVKANEEALAGIQRLSKPS
jgi:tetratricopeptide (TPR) repeat protein